MPVRFIRRTKLALTGLALAVCHAPAVTLPPKLNARLSQPHQPRKGGTHKAAVSARAAARCGTEDEASRVRWTSATSSTGAGMKKISKTKKIQDVHPTSKIKKFPAVGLLTRAS
jgi:hypothetical protein